MAGADVKKRLLAILSADAVGYSRLMAASEDDTVAALDASRAVFRGEVEQHHGRIVDMAGDSVLAVFESAAGAFGAAVGCQKTLRAVASTLPEPQRMHFRIGLHLGDVVEKDDGSVYGDGVNVAARLQALAEPGGVMVSDAVRGAIGGRLAQALLDRGEHTLKNIAQPVHAWAAVAAAQPPPGPATALASTAPRRMPWRRVAAVGAVLLAAGAGAAFMLGRPTRAPMSGAVVAASPTAGPPSIAVLPFENIGNDPEQAYFAEGLAEDLITDLSKIAGLMVIARNSSFAYKDKAADPKAVAKALGVRYVLVGSIRRSGNDVRVNAELVDGTTAGQVWAQRHDGHLKEIFAMQDEVTRNVVQALSLQLSKEDSARIAQRGGADARAYDIFLQGWQRYMRQTPADYRAAIGFFEKALEADPSYGRAYAALAAIHWDAYTRYWVEAIGLRFGTETRARAEQYLQKALRQPTPLAYQVSSAMLLNAHQYEEAAVAAQHAIDADPNDPNGLIAMAAVRSFTGKPQAALELVQRAMRLDPHFPSNFLFQQALAEFGLNRLDAARTSLERATGMSPDDYGSQRLLLAVYGQLGRQADAQRLMASMRVQDQRRGAAGRQDPIAVAAFEYWYPFALDTDRARFATGLRNAGVPS